MSFVLEPLPVISLRMDFNGCLTPCVGEAEALPPNPSRIDEIGEGIGEDISSDKNGDNGKEHPFSFTINRNTRKTRQSNIVMVAKPSGEPSRPNSGGYCLEEVLLSSEHWSKATYEKILVSSGRLLLWFWLTETYRKRFTLKQSNSSIRIRATKVRTRLK
jgi:hypothetical protein